MYYHHIFPTFHNGHNCHIRNLIGWATCYPSVKLTRISAKVSFKINLRKFDENISASHMPQHEQQIMTRRKIFYEFSMNRSHWRVHLLQWIVIANKNIWSHRDFWWWKLTLVTTFIIWCTQVLNHMIYIMWYHLIM